MRIISWNCNGAFRLKWEEIAKYNADIYVIQECELPESITEVSYQKFACNSIWEGTLQYKGLGIFAKAHIDLEKLSWDSHLLRHFIPIKVNGSFTLLAIWACAPYIEEYAVYQDIHIDKYDKEMLIIGDFNSNKIWDKKRLPDRSHSGVVKRLNDIGLSSAYHAIHNEAHGEETNPTFFRHRKNEKKFHIDYCFLDQNKIKNIEILKDESWLALSDHLPIILDISCESG